MFVNRLFHAMEIKCFYVKVCRGWQKKKKKNSWKFLGQKIDAFWYSGLFLNAICKGFRCNHIPVFVLVKLQSVFPWKFGSERICHWMHFDSARMARAKKRGILGKNCVTLKSSHIAHAMSSKCQETEQNTKPVISSRF